MMPQRAENEPIYEQAEPLYGAYEGNQPSAHQFDEQLYARPLGGTQGEKLSPQLPNHKNMFRLGIFVIAMMTLLLCAVLFIFFLGGTGAWISFIVAAFVIFVVAVVVIDKIE